MFPLDYKSLEPEHFILPQKKTSFPETVRTPFSKPAANRAESDNFPRTSNSPNLSRSAGPGWVKYGERSGPYSIYSP